MIELSETPKASDNLTHKDEAELNLEPLFDCREFARTKQWVGAAAMCGSVVKYALTLAPNAYVNADSQNIVAGLAVSGALLFVMGKAGIRQRTQYGLEQNQVIDETQTY